MRTERVVFLYTELAGYFLACLDELGGNEAIESLDVVHWPVNPQAPFNIEVKTTYSLHPKLEFSRAELRQWINDVSPTLLVVSGWTDSDYMSIAKHWVNRIPVVLALDNWWTGSLKQQIACAFSPWFIRRHFNAAWVPGRPQLEFAQRLGISTTRIKTGFYCADPKTFNPIHELRKNRPHQHSKSILFIGRYLEIKGIIELWQCFIELSDAFPEWELHCIGTGPLWDDRSEHPKITHHGFLQPQDIKAVAVKADLFVMPSHKEPWGVVLHEMTLCGMATLVSEAVGSSSMFVKHGKSGQVFQLGQLRMALYDCMSKDLETLEKEGSYSRELAVTLTPNNWNQKVLELAQLEF